MRTVRGIDFDDLTLDDLRAISAWLRQQPVPTAAKHAFDDLMMKGLQAVRNNVIHAVIMYAGGTGAPIFELRSHSRGYTKAEPTMPHMPR
jgi:hypothetical protein